MPDRSFDAIVIGTGQAGPHLADRLGEVGDSVAVVERGRVGGTCVNYGCIPTKTMVASARVAHVAGRAEDFGVEIGGEVDVDMQAVHDRTSRISGQSNDGVTGWLEGMEHVELIRGEARLTGPETVDVEGETLSGDRIFLNVGARPRVPEIEGLEEVDFMTNREILERETLPEHLVIVGGSYIGLEFGQMFRRFGSDVSIVEQGSRVIAREHPDVSQAAADILEQEGVDLYTDAECFAVESDGGDVVVKIDRPDGSETVRGSDLLLAVGRVPNTDGLGLEAAGVETDERGYVEVDERLQTSAEGIWALGDCNGEGAFTHTAFNDAQIAAGNLVDGRDRSLEDRIMTYGLFIDPPLARVGMDKGAARAADREILSAKMPMARVGRARERSETDGFMRVLVDADTERVVGATLLGIGADEVVHSLTALMYADASYRHMMDAVHIHPTVAELLPTLLEQLEPIEA